MEVAEREEECRHRKTLMNKYGFVADPQLTEHKNALEFVAQQDADEYFTKIDNMNSHNLIGTHLEPPFGFEDLLGLGMKFCPCVDPPPKNLGASTEKFSRAIRI